ncbi:MAG TPA: GNAT family N-acetyltransferase [Chthoniobacteraceae bacterium]|nr:GNAT family N-acetyltransferase [Chthoniobacteraceae bacterium]
MSEPAGAFACRPAAHEDLELLLGFVEEFYREERIPFDAKTTQDALSTLIAMPGSGSVWLIDIDRAPAGYFVITLGFILEFGGAHAVLDELYLRADFRGRGHGRAAVRKVEEICRGLPVRALRLEVDHANPRAEALYRALGFTAHERRTMTKRLRQRGEG